MRQTDKLNENNTRTSHLFTDYNGKFKARLSAVIPAQVSTVSENAPISAKYNCRIKVQYHKDIMSLVEEGMIFAVRNFRTKIQDDQVFDRYTLLVASRIWPDHYGLKAISDHTYYPMQFEVIEQSVTDWDTEDTSTMMIQISAIPVNYDLVLDGKSSSYKYVKGFSYPIIGDEVFLLNANTVMEMYNRKIIEKMSWKLTYTKHDARTDPRIGIIKMFENSKEKIPIYVDFENMIRYHFGVFSFTGGGKSCLLSNLLRRILYHTSETKIVIFDISSEYPFLLMDVFSDPNISSKIIMESPVKNVDEFYVSVVKPRAFEENENVKKGLASIYDQHRVTYYVKPESEIPRYSLILDDLQAHKKESIGKRHYIDAIDEIHSGVLNYMSTKGLGEQHFIDETFVSFLSELSSTAMETYKVSEKAGLFAWATTRDKLKDRIRLTKKRTEGGITADGIRDLIEGEARLVCISITDPYTIRQLAIDLSKDFLHRRKQQFKVKPYLLFVFDEAQEFIPNLSNARGIEEECSKAVETVLRQGRKYGLGCCVATQRIAYLNTNALQQLHTYFVSTLPRPYDRIVVSNTFALDLGILDKTLEFAPGEWLLSSYIATGIDNVPIFIRADNAEEEITSFLSTIGAK
ncbi:MAG: ATP-binding protein [Nitrososphaeraceae archaeon]